MPRQFVGVRIDIEDIKKIEKIVKESKNYNNTSEFIRNAVRELLEKY